jgi:hypothetical protein
MHKLPIPIAHDIHPAKPRWPLLHKVAIVLLGISLAPIIAEGTSICYAQWSQVMGRNTQARTPMLDSLHEHFESGSQSFWATVSPCFQRVPWSHHLVLAIGAILVIVGMMMLKL